MCGHYSAVCGHICRSMGTRMASTYAAAAVLLLDVTTGVYSVRILLHVCPHTPTYVCVLIRLHMCPHTYMSSYSYMCVLILHVSSYARMCVLILLRMCPHTPACVSSYICVLILLHVCPHTATWQQCLVAGRDVTAAVGRYKT